MIYDKSRKIAESSYILITDDMPENLEVLGSNLRNAGFRVSVSTNASQAIKIATSKKPDLILMDINMPEMDGFSACKILKEQESTKDIPLIFLTARNDTEDIVRGFESGGVDYITKPFNSNELLSRVFTHIELKHSRDTIIQQNRVLKELNLTKDKFFSIIAHDLKNPISSVRMACETLLRFADKMDKEKFIDIVKLMDDSAKSLYNLLENLLIWARAQTGRIKYEPCELNLKSLVNEAVMIQLMNARSKNIMLANNISDDLMVFADRNSTDTVIRNLVSNAIKFTPKGGTVKIDAEPEDKYARVIIKDNGIGISEDDLKKIFKIDQHHSTTGTDQEKGTGLGLILCKEFVEKNGGMIWIKSQINNGSEVIFTLPLIKEKK